MTPEIKKMIEEYVSKSAGDRKEGEGLALLNLMVAESNGGKFAPKLSFGQRCEVLALRRMGVTREVIANFYGIDRRTVTHIQNPLSKHYKNVREEEMRMGQENFMAKYMNETLANEVMGLVYTMEEKGRNNERSNGMRGVHSVRNQFCKYDHRVAIQWVEGGVKGSGWYYMDLDGDSPREWSHCGPDSMKSSHACYDAMLDNISDKL